MQNFRIRICFAVVLFLPVLPLSILAEGPHSVTEELGASGTAFEPYVSTATATASLSASGKGTRFTPPRSPIGRVMRFSQSPPPPRGR